MNTANAPVPPSAALRTRTFSGHPEISRASTAARTIITQIAVSPSIQALFTSLPVPKPCSSAIGQQA